MNSISWQSKIKPYTQLLFRWGWFIILCMVATTVTTFFFPDYASPDTYTATLRIQVTLPTTTSNSKVDVNNTTAFYASLFTKDTTLSPLVNKYLAKYPGTSNNDVLSALQSSIVTLPITGTNYFTLSATPSFYNASQKDATTLVNDVFNAGVQELRTKRNSLITNLTTALNTELQQSQSQLISTGSDMKNLEAANQTDTFVYLEDESLYKAQLARVTGIQKQIQTLQLQQLTNDSLLHVASGQADILTNVSSAPTQSIRYAFSPLVGLLMGVGGAMLASMFSVRVPLRGKKRESVLPRVIATIPPLPGTRNNELTTIKASAPCTALFRHLRYQAREHEKTLSVVTVTGAGGHEGKSFVAAGLAFAAAQNGVRTILVDANTRHPVQHSWFQLPNRNGVLNVIDALSQGTTGSLPIQPTFHPYLGLLPVGTSNASSDPLLEDLPVNKLRVLTGLLYSQADLVIFDGPSLLDDANAANLTQLSDMVLLVVNAQTSKSTAVIDAENVLSSIAVPSAYVLNRADLETVE